MHIGDGKNTPF
jgi:hypothetical protein